MPSRTTSSGRSAPTATGVGSDVRGNGLWEATHTRPHQTPAILDFAQLWQTASKNVCSKTLGAVSTARMRSSETSTPKRSGG